MIGLVRQAAPGPWCSKTTATRSGSVGCVARTGSQARSATERGSRLTRASCATKASSAAVVDGTGDALAVPATGSRSMASRSMPSRTMTAESPAAPVDDGTSERGADRESGRAR